MSNMTAHSRFASTPLNPPDAIFGLIEDFKRDERPNKVNLTVGVYQNDAGQTPSLECVREAEKALWEKAEAKKYLPIDGLRGYNNRIGNLILGDELCPLSDEIVRSTSVHSVTAQTPGGTAALRIAGDFLSKVAGANSIWMSNPMGDQKAAVPPRIPPNPRQRQARKPIRRLPNRRPTSN